MKNAIPKTRRAATTTLAMCLVAFAAVGGCSADVSEQTADTTTSAAAVTATPTASGSTPAAASTSTVASSAPQATSPSSDSSATTSGSADDAYRHVDTDVYSTSTDLDRVPMKVAIIRAIAHQVPQCRGIKFPTAPVAGSPECRTAASTEATRRIAAKTSQKLADDVNMAFVGLDMFGVPGVDEKALEAERVKCVEREYPDASKGWSYVFAGEKARLLGMSGADEYLAEKGKGKGDPAQRLTPEQRREYVAYDDKLRRHLAKCQRPMMAGRYAHLLDVSKEQYSKYPELRPAVEEIINLK